MENLLIVNHHLHAPYFIFIKGGARYEDEEVLQLLGLTDYQPRNSLSSKRLFSLRPQSHHLVHLTRDGEWLHIIDDWYYTLWYSKSLRKHLRKLSAIHDIFICDRGDTDCSFSFQYIKDGKLVRHYVVDSPNYDDEVLTKNKGKPLPGEEEALQEKDQLERGLAVARNLGIKINHKLEDIRTFAKPYTPKH